MRENFRAPSWYSEKKENCGDKLRRNYSCRLLPSAAGRVTLKSRASLRPTWYYIHRHKLRKRSNSSPLNADYNHIIFPGSTEQHLRDSLSLEGQYIDEWPPVCWWSSWHRHRLWLYSTNTFRYNDRYTLSSYFISIKEPASLLAYILDAHLPQRTKLFHFFKFHFSLDRLLQRYVLSCNN